MFIFPSCKVVRIKGAPVKPYFQDSTATLPVTLETTLPQVSRIQKEDLLGITVSSLDRASNDILNFSNGNSLTMSALPGGGGGGSQPIGYLVDSTGNIAMAYIGKIRVEGMTLELAQDRIREKLEVYVKEPAVNIRFMNHKFVVLGEVQQVGAFNLLDDRTTLIDALASAGDLTPFAKRDSLMIIRNINGKREIAQVSMLNREIFNSPYFYVRNGDVIYAQPRAEKVVPLPPETQNAEGYRRLQVFLAVLTAITLTINLILLF